MVKHPPPTPPAAPIVVDALSKTYGRGADATPVLRDLSFSVARGEWVFLVGPSGSGKTTLLSILGCVLSPDAGRVEVLGRDVRSLSPQAAAELRLRNIGFIFQRFHLIRGLTAQENVSVPLTLQGANQTVARRRADELLAAVGLAEHRHRNVRKLSVGQCQRVALARALVTNPDLILADEPTASLDGEHGHAAMQLLRELTTQSGATVIVVTHDPRIQSFADRVLKLENGQLCANQSPLSPNTPAPRNLGTDEIRSIGEFTPTPPEEPQNEPEPMLVVE
ncbi:MAG: ABC transporter ATP-binding protein [Planctomycetota bacterium]|nr:MAG: ABC transporter ATP-binding protein [Planctomycetota bacterium]